MGAQQTPHSDIAMSVKLFGIGKAALDGFLAPFIESLAFTGQSMRVDFLPFILPDMPSDGFDLLGIAGALAEPGTVSTEFWV